MAVLPKLFKFKPVMQTLLQGRASNRGLFRLGIATNKIREFHTNEQLCDIYEITDEQDFKKKVMRNSIPVIVNFHADWCEPCHSLKPLLEKIANENEGRLHLAEVLVDDHVDLLHAFEVEAIPAVLGIHRGIVTEKFVGLVSHRQVMEFVEKLLERTAK